MTDLIGCDCMRLISQDEKMCFPYDYTVVYQEENHIVAFTVESPFNRIVATYSTERLAEEAMRDLIRANSNTRAWYRFPSEKELCAKLGLSVHLRQATVTC